MVGYWLMWKRYKKYIIASYDEKYSNLNKVKMLTIYLYELPLGGLILIIEGIIIMGLLVLILMSVIALFKEFAISGMGMVFAYATILYLTLHAWSLSYGILRACLKALTK